MANELTSDVVVVSVHIYIALSGGLIYTWLLKRINKIGPKNYMDGEAAECGNETEHREIMGADA